MIKQLRWLPLYCGVLLLLAGCPINRDNTGPSVETTSLTPGSQTLNVDLNTTVQLRFSEAVDPSSLTSSSFTLTSSSGGSTVQVSGNISVSGNSATFTPNTALALSTTYTVTITTAVKDLAGNALQTDSGGNYSWTFTTRDQIWHGQQSLSSSGLTATAAATDMNDGGLGLAIWTQSDGSRQRVYSNIYDNTGPLWLGEILADTGGGSGDASAAKVMLDNSNIATAVWLQSDGSHTRVYANRMDLATSQWGTPTAISTNTSGSAQTPDISISRDTGEAIVVWSEWNGSRYAVHASRFDGSNWSAPTVLDSGTASALVPHVAVNNLGEAWAVWRQHDGVSAYHIYASRFDGSVWIASGRIDTGSGSSDEARVTISNNGLTAVAWSQDDGTRRSIYASIYYPIDSTWAKSFLLETDSAGDADVPTLAINGSDEVMVVWQQDVDIRTIILANQYVLGAGWKGAVQLSLSDDTEAVDPRVSSDGNGNFLAVWAHGSAGERVIYSKRHEGEWDSLPPTLISNSTANDRSLPQIATDSAGNAMAVWLRDGVEILVNHFR